MGKKNQKLAILVALIIASTFTGCSNKTAEQSEKVAEVEQAESNSNRLSKSDIESIEVLRGVEPVKDNKPKLGYAFTWLKNNYSDNGLSWR